MKTSERNSICYVTIRNRNGEVHGPREMGTSDDWNNLGPVDKVLRVHSRMRKETMGETFEFMKVESKKS